MEYWAEGLIILAFLVAIGLIPFICIFQEAGRSGWWAVIMVFPLISTFVPWVIPFFTH
jgi:hypothetical protein